MSSERCPVCLSYGFCYMPSRCPKPDTPIPDCFDLRTPGVVCPHHAHRRYGTNDCWNLRDEHGEHLETSISTPDC